DADARSSRESRRPRRYDASPAWLPSDLAAMRCPCVPAAALSPHRVGRRGIRARLAAPQASRIAERGLVEAWRAASGRRHGLVRSAGRWAGGYGVVDGWGGNLQLGSMLPVSR